MDLVASLNTCARPFETLDDAAEWCAQWLDFRATVAPPGVRLAAVFDIDATLVDNSGGRIESTCALLERCRALRITPFFITARSEEGRDYTEEQLRKLGLGDSYKRLFMHPAHVPHSGAGQVKHHARERIQAHDYTICFNAGDAPHDHMHPVPMHVKQAFRREPLCAFVTPDGTAHLKLPH